MDSQPKVAVANPRVAGERLSATAPAVRDLSKSLAVYTHESTQTQRRREKAGLASVLPAASSLDYFRILASAKLLATIISASKTS